MPRGGFDYSQFEQMANKFKNAERNSEELIKAVVFELANRWLRKTKQRTVVDTGWERENWYITGVQRGGGNLIVELYNPVEYAQFDEYGHRTRNGGWVEGKFMATISAKEIEAIAPRLLKQRSDEFLKDLFKD